MLPAVPRAWRKMWLAQPKDRREGLVDTPLFFRSHPAHKLAEPSGIDGADLLNQHPGGRPSRSISGRNDAGRTLRDVGATSTTERGRNSLS